MVNITVTTSEVELQNCTYYVDAKFSLFEKHENYYNTPLDMEVMKLIDGITGRDDNVLLKGKTALTLSDLSTGSKAAILALHGFTVYFATMGINAMSALIDIATKNNVDISLHVDYVPMTTCDKGTPIVVNGVPMKLCDLAEFIDKYMEENNADVEA